MRGRNGVFDVAVDGKRIFSKREAGRFPEHAEILAKISELASAGDQTR